MNTEKKFKLFACCIPVKGSRRSTICDVQRSEYQFIPNILYEILTELKDKSISSIKAHYNNEHDNIIDEYFSFLLNNEYGFLCDNPDSFPDIDLTWKVPATITNVLIDVDASSQHDYHSIFQQLEELGCKAIQLRFYTQHSLNEVSDILTHIQNTRIKSIEIVIPYKPEFTIESLTIFSRKHPHISNVIIHSSPKEEFDHDNYNHIFYFIETPVDATTHCGQISGNHFRTDISLFTEAQSYNTCLNRKISVDQKGNIKNCPSFPNNYGNITDTSFKDALKHPDFKKLWSINKDQIHVCKDCEFRYICTDCRAYVDDPKDIYSKPLKCGYNPYSGEWEAWAENPLKQKAIEYYQLSVPITSNK